MWTAFEYLYRDAANFKAFGAVNLEGELSPADQQLIRDQLFGEEFFIAEQVGVPTLYQQLYRWSDGPTADDHCWHEFGGFRQLAAPDGDFPTVAADEFVARFLAVGNWIETLSPHFWIEEAN